METLQSAAIMAALPFSVVIWIMVNGFNRALHDEPQSPRRGKHRRISRDPLTESSGPSQEKRQEKQPAG